MTAFALFAWPLRRAGFRKTWDSRSGGVRIIEWRRDDSDGRTLVCQIWADGKHRINHEWVGCSDTLPTDFTDKAGLALAIEHEATRTDGYYRDPNNHNVPSARAFLLARQSPPAYDAECQRILWMQKSLLDAEAEIARLQDLINAPIIDDWFVGVRMEAAHQQERYGSNNDNGKTPMDWFWLIGYLAGKIVASIYASDKAKAKHHTISAGAALFNWWRAILEDPSATMRPGIDRKD